MYNQQQEVVSTQIWLEEFKTVAIEDITPPPPPPPPPWLNPLTVFRLEIKADSGESR